jgi:hypothetical protein
MAPPLAFGEPGQGVRGRGHVSHFAGWRDLAVIDAASETRIQSSNPPPAYLFRDWLLMRDC